MAPGGRPSVTIGIQPQIALYSVILGGVCAFGWYTEKYRRDEDDIDGQIKMMYRSDIKDAHDKLPQMTKTIRGQDMRLDDRMNNLVWGGKAALEQQNSGSTFGGGFGGGKGFKHDNGDNGDDDDGHVRVNIARSASSEDASTTTKKRKRRKRKGKKTKKAEKEKAEQEKATEKQKLVMQSTVVGVGLGALAVAAVTLMSSRSSSR